MLILVLTIAMLLAGCAGTIGTKKKVIILTSSAVTNLTQITTEKGPDTYPSISPDGEKLAFQRRRGDDYDIWLVNAKTGRGFTRVTNHPLDDRNPAWFPDGQTLVFDSPRVDTTSLWRKRMTGSGGITQLTKGGTLDFDANVSLDGRRIVFTSQMQEIVYRAWKEGQEWKLFISHMPHIWMVDTTGSNLTQFGRGIGPVWSPDGTKVVFASNVSGNFDIWVMDADGGNVTQLTTHKENDVEPCWSPDGTKIAFASKRAGAKEKPNYNIWVMSADGGNLTQLTIDKPIDGAPSWSRKGDIYFHSKRDGDWNIWRMTPDLDF